MTKTLSGLFSLSVLFPSFPEDTTRSKRKSHQIELKSLLVRCHQCNGIAWVTRVWSHPQLHQAAHYHTLCGSIPLSLFNSAHCNLELPSWTRPHILRGGERGIVSLTEPGQEQTQINLPPFLTPIPY